ncbi:MAG: hypothetical protein HXS50_02000 [Theionarchaea archaeon]|nr:hypothetical protein [Theionarchaea archaeon]
MKPVAHRALLIAILIIFSVPCQCQKIRVLLTGQVDVQTNPLIMWFGQESSVDATAVPTRSNDLVKTEDIKRFVRLYFPRTYQQVREFDFIILHSPEMFHLTREQDRWMHDAIKEGAGAMAAPAGLSDHGDIQHAWINSIVQRALPNDFSLVLASGGRRGQTPFHIEVNRDFPEPVLTPFIPLGIEDFPGAGGNMIIGREGSRILAWQIGQALGRVPYMIAWDYGEGRGLTLADSLHLTFWSDYISLRNPAYETTQNQYSLDILMNMVLYLTRRSLPEDVLAVHKMRTSFAELRIKMSLLISLSDFAQKFGADGDRLGEILSPLVEMGEQAEDRYLEQDFEESERILNSLFEDISRAETRILKIKETALLWVYTVEWLVVTSTLMLSSFGLWTLMVRRKLYRHVGTTQLERSRVD